MGKNEKKLNSLDALKAIKIEEDGFKMKSEEEIAKLKADEKKKERTPEDYLTKKKTALVFSKEHLTNINASRVAVAPYNFIPLNEKVVPAEFDKDSIPDMSLFDNKRNSGFIDIEIVTKTPVYIRDTYNSDEIGEKERNERYVNHNFYSPGGKAKIPGSSLRGLFHSFVEITSFAKYGDVDDKTLYFRDFTNEPLRHVYDKYGLTTKDGEKVKYNMGSGMLFKQGIKYYIKDYGHPRKLKKENTINEAEKAGVKLISDKWNWFITSDKKRVIVISGGLKDRDGKLLKKKDWMFDLFDEDENEKRTIKKEPSIIQLSQKDVYDFETDYETRKSTLNRDMVPNLLKLVSDSKKEIPVFFYVWNDNEGNQRISIGHTGMIRVPYQKSIGDHIPSDLKDENIIDLADALFGKKELFAGRLFFEDAVCSSDENIFMGVQGPQILSGPKATTLQHYLIQNSDYKEELFHYNSGDLSNPVLIRGNKLYWHKNVNETEWVAKPNDVVKAPKQYTKINPVKPGTTFTGRIRFENLSNIELGALLFALQLPPGCCHKIGMGKPLGLGSIRITPKLHLSNRINRYRNLADEWISEPQISKEDSSFKDSFSSYIINYLNGSASNQKYNSDDLWSVKRMEELKIMLDFEHKPDNTKTKYMKIQPKPNEFRDRPVLPKPSDVK